MAGDNSKPGIPAWQRGSQAPNEQHDDTDEQPTATASPSDLQSTAPTEDVQTEMTPAAQLENMKTFLEDPAVRDKPLEKKRAFFESKGISKDLIDQVLQSEEPAIKASDFESFKQQQQAQPKSSPPPTQQKPSGPPIITYPEFLVEAHKPPPLITLARIWNTAQIASGVAALIYGASKYLVTPMTENLNEARHDFALHSQSKLDTFNERLSTLVSKTPAQHKLDCSTTTDGSDTDSTTSDPTELYHRDIGTQTSPPPSRSPSTFTLGGAAADSSSKKSPTDYQVTGLQIIASHLNEMLTQSEKVGEANRARQEKMNSLRHYLDTLMYASPGISVWSSAEDIAKADGGGGGVDGGMGDAVEELKREIRGVKGVMLSAKRFPGVAARAGG